MCVRTQTSLVVSSVTSRGVGNAPDGKRAGVDIARRAEREVSCPHCKKPFTAPLLAGRAARHRGYKCPHCRLFVPERPDADEPLTREAES